VLVFRKDRNPLAFVFWPTLVTLPLWIPYWRDWHGFVGTAVILTDILLILLYLRRSRFAWHLALCLNLGLGVYHLAAGRHPRVDIIITAILVIYLFVVRQPYFTYVGAADYEKSNQALEPTAGRRTERLKDEL
jgi:hypothetical protein